LDLVIFLYLPFSVVGFEVEGFFDEVVFGFEFFAVSWIAKILEIPFQLDFGTIVALMQDIFGALELLK
jgi:hypothetical protein